MTFQTLLTSLENQILTVTLNRPELRNAFNPLLIEELIQVFKQTNNPPRAVVLKGQGKTFSAGGDLNWMKESRHYSQEQNLADAQKLSIMLSSINDFPAPVIGLVQGAALGGGMGLISVCDYVITTKETLFGFTETRLGLIPAVIGPFCFDKIGSSQTRALFLTAQRFNAHKAWHIGLVHEVVPTEADLEPALMRMLAELKELSPQATKTAKAFIASLKGLSWEQQQALAAQTLASVRLSNEAQEGIDAFLEKRKPSWSL